MSEPLAWCNLLVILVTVAVSYAGFRDPEVERKYIFRPESILAGKEYYRLVTSGFLHAGWGHLACNMVSLYLFGRILERSLGRTDFLLDLLRVRLLAGASSLSMSTGITITWLMGLRAAYAELSLPIFSCSLGRGSGCISRVPIPGWVYAIGFMVVSFVAMKNAKDNIGHDAHLGGAIIGLLICRRAFTRRPSLTTGRSSCLVLGFSVLLLIYLWINPLFLPVPSFLRPPIPSQDTAVEPAQAQTGGHAGGCHPRQDRQERGGQPDRRGKGFAGISLRETPAPGGVQEAGVGPGDLILIVNPLPRR